MRALSPAAFGLLGLLATRSWTGYELTEQVRRSLPYVWPISEGHLYREQRRLVDEGWVSIEEEPHLQVEGVLRAFYADQGTSSSLVSPRS